MDPRRPDRLWRLVTERAGDRRHSGWAGVVCAVAVEQLGLDAAAISLTAGSRAQELVAATDDWAGALEELQYTVGEGPGPEAFATGGPVLISDLTATDQRWPGFTDHALAEGVAAVFAFPLQSGAIRLGVLDLYHRRAGSLSPERLADAAVLGDLATTALLTDASGADKDMAPWARGDAAGHYEDVNMATGMLAAQLRISVEDAFLRLRAHAYSNDLPLLEVARQVLQRRLRLDLSAD